MAAFWIYRPDDGAGKRSWIEFGLFILLSLPFISGSDGVLVSIFLSFISASILASFGDIYDGQAFSLASWADSLRWEACYHRLSLVRNVTMTYFPSVVLAVESWW